MRTWNVGRKGGDDSISTMFDRVNHSTEQSHALATLRDTLLPKLLSGELSVAGAERVAS